MKIVVTGTRGIPNILGGVETHCQQLYPRIVEAGHEVILIRRKAYVSETVPSKEYKGVVLKDIWTPKQKSFEAIIHTFLAIIYAKKVDADVLHIHAIGPAIMVPFARMFGLKVVMTHHGPDYDRQKWNKIAKTILKVGEYLGARFSNKIIVISKVIDEIVHARWRNSKTVLIFNGVEVLPVSDNRALLSSYGLVPNDYIVAVGRFVPEKGFHDLIEAYRNMKTQMKLVLVGEADHESEYSRNLKKLAIDYGVVLTGFKSGDELRALFGNARLFVLPSYHEGLPIALLEAMSLGLNVLVSNIPANMVVGLDEKDYFQVSNIVDLQTKIEAKLTSGAFTDYIPVIKSKYNWDIIAQQTINVYEQVLKGYT